MTRQRNQEKQSTSTEPTSYNCEHCKDTGDVWVNAWTMRECTHCNIKKIEETQRKIAASRITEEFKTKIFKNFDKENIEPDVKEAYNTAVDYVTKYKGIKKNRQNSIALLGSSGCGKTHLLMAVSNNLLRQGIEVVYFPWVETIRELSDADKEKRADMVHRFQQCEVLFIDDLFKGREAPTAFQFEIIWSILNYRYLNHKAIMISSERSISDLLDIDIAVGSRISEMTDLHRAFIQGDIDKVNYRIKGIELL